MGFSLIRDFVQRLTEEPFLFGGPCGIDVVRRSLRESPSTHKGPKASASD
mgnify:CR=1 FL=1